MKRLLFSLGLFLIINFGFSQANVYHPFPDSNAVWRETYYFNPCNCPNPCMNTCGSEIQYVMGGDTVIGGFSYHKLTLQSSYSFNWNYAPPGPPVFWAGIRQDTTARKVFCCIPVKGVADTLLYDFTMNVGDTLKGFLANFTTTLTVTAVDSILIGSSYHRRMVLGPAIGGLALYHEIIEGVGFTAGLLDNTYTAEEGGQLICFSEEAQPLYPNANCGQQFFSVNIPKAPAFKAQPVPAHDYVELSNLGEGTLFIYNSLGEMVATRKTRHFEERLDIQELEKGIYFLYYVSENRSGSAIFIKE